MPQCGFSAQVVPDPGSAGPGVFDGGRALGPGDPPGHQGLLLLAHDSQLYVDGEFLGGCDIVMEMAQNGELQQTLSKGAATA